MNTFYNIQNKYFNQELNKFEISWKKEFTSTIIDLNPGKEGHLILGAAPQTSLFDLHTQKCLWTTPYKSGEEQYWRSYKHWVYQDYIYSGYQSPLDYQTGQKVVEKTAEGMDVYQLGFPHEKLLIKVFDTLKIYDIDNKELLSQIELIRVGLPLFAEGNQLFLLLTERYSDIGPDYYYLSIVNMDTSEQKIKKGFPVGTYTLAAYQNLYYFLYQEQIIVLNPSTNTIETIELKNANGLPVLKEGTLYYCNEEGLHQMNVNTQTVNSRTDKDIKKYTADCKQLLMMNNTLIGVTPKGLFKIDTQNKKGKLDFLPFNDTELEIENPESFSNFLVIDGALYFAIGKRAEDNDHPSKLFKIG